MAAQPLADTPTPIPDNRRITEHAPAVVALKAKTVRKLQASVNRLLRDLRPGSGVPQGEAQSQFIQRHVGILRAAYSEAHRLGQRQYYDGVSRDAGRWAREEPDQARMARTLAFYAPSVAKIAHEAAVFAAAARVQQAIPGASHVAALSDLAVVDAQGHSERSVRLGDTTDPTDAYAEWQQNLGARIMLQADLTWSGAQDGYVAAGWGDSANPYSSLWWNLEPIAQHCFPAGTMVSTPDGDRPIEALRVGDHVETLSGPRRVTKLWRKAHEGALTRVAANGRMVECTPNHPFLTQRGWETAGNLRDGDQIVLAQDGGDFVAAHVRLPDAYDGIAAGCQIGVLGAVTSLLRKLAFGQRLEARMAVPVVPVSLDNQHADTDVHHELVFNHGRWLEDNTEFSEHGAQPSLQFAGLVALEPLMASAHLRKSRLSGFWVRRIPRHALRQARRVTHRIVGNHMGASCRVNYAMARVFGKPNAQLSRLGRDGANGKTKCGSNGLRPFFRIVLAQIGDLFVRPFARWSRRNIATTRTETYLAQPVVAALGTGFHLDEMPGIASLVVSQIAIAASNAAKAADRRTTPMFLEHRSAPFTSVLRRHSDTPHFLSTSIPQQTAVYNLSVEEVEHYIANGFVVHNCSDCPVFAAGSPYDPPWVDGGNILNATPGDGNTECGAACKCDLSYGGALGYTRTQDWKAWLPQNMPDAPDGPMEPVQPPAGKQLPAPPPEPSEEQPSRVPPSPFELPEGVRRSPYGPIIPGGEFTDGQKAALDLYRLAELEWNAVRGQLPELPNFFTLANPNFSWPRLKWEELTKAQQKALSLALEAWFRWSASLPEGWQDYYDEDPYAFGEPIESEHAEA